MNAIYHQSIRGEFELSDHDRNEVKLAYGMVFAVSFCLGKADLINSLQKVVVHVLHPIIIL